MFESAELGHSIPDREYDREEPKLREALLKAQYDLLGNKSFPVIILIGGVDGAGKGETVNILNEWMDPRFIHAHAFGEMSDEERERPRMWRYWRALPPKGRIGVLFGAWHTDPIVNRVVGKTDDAQMELAMEEIVRFERMLVDEGALILKFWFHLSKKAQKKRLKALESDPKTRWRVTDTDWERFKLYDRFRKVSENALRETSTGYAPWTVVEGTDPNYRYLTVGRTLLEALKKRLTGDKPAVTRPAALPEPALDGRNVLSSLDYERTLTRKAYNRKLEKYQGELNLLSRHKKFRNKSLIIVMEGVDAAGKGGSIRRVTGALDSRHYQVTPIAAPSEEERAQPYLWRFWRHLPRKGRVTIFDRSWYGRVLVERVEKFCSEQDWMRAYHEINDFEEQLVEAGGIVTKFWVTVTKEEQLRRFREREKTPFKSFKITPEDWRNRKKWNDYERAVCDMIERTSNELAPWVLVAANDKFSARIEILKTLCERVEAAL
ncbi:MAG: polyphosphate:AMP phosphotransferase [Betaproteobacteria bacterium]|nr:polyphosphate:AMP phosphotransferase [Betaproteobacteria bacterium]